ncbi:MAG: hypothetical protein D6723_15225 [Acidobacteria bacterium]|nr:MAG: hypothetical protein D6723_15225 [Acidobacteriota bacterium]
MRHRLHIPAIIILFGVYLLSGCRSSGTTESAATSEGAKATTVEVAHPELFPKDDGYVCALFYGAEILGSLDDCGCPRHPEGGLIWRMGYTRAFAERSPDVPVLQVDLGYFFSDRRDRQGRLYPYVEKGNEWVLKAYDKMNFTAANLTAHDLPYAERLLERKTYRKAAREMPMLTRFISANVHARRRGYVSPPPFLIHHVTGRRLPQGATLRIGFVGLTEPPETSVSPAFTIDDPLTAARRVIPKLRAQCDMLVVLAYLPPATVERLARDVAGIDLILDAYKFRKERDAVRINRTTIAYARYQTRSLGEVLIYVDERGRPTDLRTRMVRLDEAVPWDKEAEKLVDAAVEEIDLVKEEYVRKHRGSQTLPLTPTPWK